MTSESIEPQSLCQFFFILKFQWFELRKIDLLSLYEWNVLGIWWAPSYGTNWILIELNMPELLFLLEDLSFQVTEWVTKVPATVVNIIYPVL